jgi:hypothetical protein
VLFILVNEMGRIDVVLPDDLERRLREAVFRRKGMKRGNLKKAVNEAIILWIDRERKR